MTKSRHKHDKFEQCKLTNLNTVCSDMHTRYDCKNDEKPSDEICNFLALICKKECVLQLFKRH